MGFPASADALSQEWLASALGYNVTSFNVEYFGEGTSIIGMVTRVHIDGDNGPTSIIAKFPSPAAENRAVAAAYDMYSREVNFYQNIAPHIQLRVPDCYFAEFNPQTLDFIILMEDLQSMRIGDQVAGCSEEDARLVIAGIAKLHASTWQTTQLIVSHNNPGQRDGMIGGFQIGWPVVCKQFPDLIPAGVAELAERMPEHVAGLLDTMCTEPVCITHADMRLDNIFFGTDEIALVDWQSACTSAPEQDLAYFVTQSLSDEVRNAQDWVALYHAELTNNGIEYDLLRCRERYRVTALYLLCYAVVIAGTLDLGNERGLALGRTLFGNAMRSLTELDAFSLLAP
jgi:hypothetical protein